MATTQRIENVAETTDTLTSKIGYVVGVDNEYSAHVHYPASDTIKVYDVGEDYEIGDYIDSDPVHVEDISGRPLAAWMEYVDHERGFKLTTHRAPEFGGDDR